MSSSREPRHARDDRSINAPRPRPRSMMTDYRYRPLSASFAALLEDEVATSTFTSTSTSTSSLSSTLSAPSTSILREPASQSSPELPTPHIRPSLHPHRRHTTSLASPVRLSPSPLPSPSSSLRPPTISARPHRSSPLAGPAFVLGSGKGEEREDGGKGKGKGKEALRVTKSVPSLRGEGERERRRREAYMGLTGLMEDDESDFQSGLGAGGESRHPPLPPLKPKIKSSASSSSSSHGSSASASGSREATWQTMNAYASIPRFSRVGLGAEGVVLPVRAKSRRGREIRRAAGDGSGSGVGEWGELRRTSTGKRPGVGQRGGDTGKEKEGSKVGGGAESGSVLKRTRTRSTGTVVEKIKVDDKRPKSKSIKIKRRLTTPWKRGHSGGERGEVAGMGKVVEVAMTKEARKQAVVEVQVEGVMLPPTPPPTPPPGGRRDMDLQGEKGRGKGKGPDMIMSEGRARGGETVKVKDQFDDPKLGKASMRKLVGRWLSRGRGKEIGVVVGR